MILWVFLSIGLAAALWLQHVSHRELDREIIRLLDERAKLNALIEELHRLGAQRVAQIERLQMRAMPTLDYLKHPQYTA